MGKVTVIDALKEHYDMLKDAYKKGANLAPCDFDFIAEYENKSVARTSAERKEKG